MSGLTLGGMRRIAPGESISQRGFGRCGSNGVPRSKRSCVPIRGIALSEKSGTRRYATWEHVMPGNASSVVLTADLIDKMKCDSSEQEFRTLVRALAAADFDPQEFDESAFPEDRHRS